jgi:hypothetical protein
MVKNGFNIIFNDIRIMIEPENKTKKIELENHTFYVKNGILYVIAVGDTNEEIALKIKAVVLEIFKSSGKINTFIDMNESGKSTPEARKIWKELSEHENTGKVAFVGLHMVARVIAGFLMKVSGNKKSRFFSNREEALEWLKNDSL